MNGARFATTVRALAARVLFVGIVLSPLRATAATISLLIVYDAAVRPASTAALGRPYAVGREAEGAGINDYEATAFGYDGRSNLRVTAGVGPARESAGAGCVLVGGVLHREAGGRGAGLGALR